MPLAFPTLNQGVIPFGFFNVRSHMVLLAEYFAFADDVCGCIEVLADGPDPAEPGPRPNASELVRPAWRIAARADVGDLHGAMAGMDLSGFIGAVYRQFPFPERRVDFRQDPDGHCTRGAVEEVVRRFGEPVELRIVLSEPAGTVDVGGYVFDAPGFGDLVRYLWRGGLPRWTNDERPAYVRRMMAAVRVSPSWLFRGQAWPE
jgi:hypothetical protein